MKTGVWTLGALVMMFLAATSVAAQTHASCNQNLDAAQPRIIREIKDPHTGQTWWLLSDAAFPAGPGRMVRSEEVSCLKLKPERGQEKPKIRRGERVLVEEHSGVAEAVWEATAMEPAQTGSELLVRLKIGGRIIRAVAVAPGRAVVRQ